MQQDRRDQRQIQFKLTEHDPEFAVRQKGGPQDRDRYGQRKHGAADEGPAWAGLMIIFVPNGFQRFPLEIAATGAPAPWTQR